MYINVGYTCNKKNIKQQKNEVWQIFPNYKKLTAMINILLPCRELDSIIRLSQSNKETTREIIEKRKKDKHITKTTIAVHVPG